jgi:hypothetical protein
MYLLHLGVFVKGQILDKFKAGVTEGMLANSMRRRRGGLQID